MWVWVCVCLPILYNGELCNKTHTHIYISIPFYSILFNTIKREEFFMWKSCWKRISWKCTFTVALQTKKTTPHKLWWQWHYTHVCAYVVFFFFPLYIWNIFLWMRHFLCECMFYFFLKCPKRSNWIWGCFVICVFVWHFNKIEKKRITKQIECMFASNVECQIECVTNGTRQGFFFFLSFCFSPDFHLMGI